MSNRDGALIYRDLANLLAGRDSAGAPAAGAGVVSREEVVTQTEPLLMTRPVTSAPGAASASVRATDAVRGVHVGDLVIVETRGVADRVATAAVTPRPLTDRAAGDQVATIGAKTVAVGESVTLSQIGATPDGIGAAPTSHTHTIPSTACTTYIDVADVGYPTYSYFDDAIPSMRTNELDIGSGVLSALTEKVIEVELPTCRSATLGQVSTWYQVVWSVALGLIVVTVGSPAPDGVVGP